MVPNRNSVERERTPASWGLLAGAALSALLASGAVGLSAFADEPLPPVPPPATDADAPPSSQQAATLPSEEPPTAPLPPVSSSPAPISSPAEAPPPPPSEAPPMGSAAPQTPPSSLPPAAAAPVSPEAATAHATDATDSPAPHEKQEEPLVSADERHEEPEAPPAPPEASTSSSITASSSPEPSSRRREETDATWGVPAYTLTRPSWGVELSGSFKALGGDNLLASQSDNATRSFQVSAEYQPPFFQSLGVLGLGPSVGIYPIGGGITANPVSLWDVGAQIRYQARFFREQLLVPEAGFEVRRLSYSFRSGPSGSLTASGPYFGLMLLLNFLEPGSAADLYIEHAISRSYLVAEAHGLSGNDSNLSFSGQSFFFGLRLEF